MRHFTNFKAMSYTRWPYIAYLFATNVLASLGCHFTVDGETVEITQLVVCYPHGKVLCRKLSQVGSGIVRYLLFGGFDWDIDTCVAMVTQKRKEKKVRKLFRLFRRSWRNSIYAQPGLVWNIPNPFRHLLVHAPAQTIRRLHVNVPLPVTTVTPSLPMGVALNIITIKKNCKCTTYNSYYALVTY